jgi:hypothetical protein
VEGDRIVSINGVDLRVNAADAGDSYAAELPTRRLTREVGKLSPGNVANIRVWSGGRIRDVQVTVGRASDLREPGGFGSMEGMPGLMRAMPNFDGMRMQMRTMPRIQMDRMMVPRIQMERMMIPRMKLDQMRDRMRDAWTIGPDGEIIIDGPDKAKLDKEKVEKAKSGKKKN